MYTVQNTLNNFSITLVPGDQTINLSTYPSIYPSIQPSTYLFIYPSISLPAAIPSGGLEDICLYSAIRRLKADPAISNGRISI